MQAEYNIKHDSGRTAAIKYISVHNLALTVIDYINVIKVFIFLFCIEL